MSNEPAPSPTVDRRVADVASNADLGFVADALAKSRQDIIGRWLAAAQAQPFHRERPAGAVADHIPVLFDAVLAVLRRHRPREDDAPVPLDDASVTAAAEAHAQARFEQGLGPVAVTTEFRLLRQEISRALAAQIEASAPPSDVVAGMAIVGDTLDGAAAVGLTALSDRIEIVRESFLATTLHDVRQPITLVEGSLHLASRWLAEPDSDTERVRESVGDALLAAGELIAMIDTLSDASRVAMGALELDREPASLEGIAREAVDAYGATARTRVEVVGSEGRHLIGDWDAALIKRVVVNLVGNALKYSGPDGLVRLKVGPGSSGMARLTVDDQGIGMTGDELAVVFDRFVRAEGGRRSGAPGLGLGLYACRGIVTAHGGSIELRSEGRGRGTTVIVELPLIDESGA
jgi:signal transduction histidine kinase